MFEMTPYETYIFVLCLIVFSLFTIFFTVMLGYFVSLHIKLIRHGVVDKKIKIEYQKREEKAPSKLGRFFDRFFSVAVCLMLCSAFAFSMYMKVNETQIPEDVPALRVVQSSSMARKHEKNTYLVGVNNQVQMFDLITVYQMPEESELQLYDVVVYEKNGDFVLHRIVEIEEPNGFHPNERWYKFQGDAVSNSDSDPVLYSQMRGIYRNERIPFVGSFIMFMQSPAGYLCILLVLIAVIATPILEKRLERAKTKRMRLISSNRSLEKLRLSNPKKILWEAVKVVLVFGAFRYLYRNRLKRGRKKDRAS